MMGLDQPINSSPLFIILAESTEIFAPMLQFGWATACAGVTRFISTGGRPTLPCVSDLAKLG
jgi:hypothetical protein